MQRTLLRERRFNEEKGYIYAKTINSSFNHTPLQAECRQRSVFFAWNANSMHDQESNQTKPATMKVKGCAKLDG